jgi:uncharacterized membrane protein YfcA
VPSAAERATLSEYQKNMPGFEGLTPLCIAWIAAVIFFGGFVQGSLGLGFPLVATPLIAFATGIHTAVVIVLLPCIACVVLTMWKSPKLRETLAQFWMMPLWAFIGASIGTRLFVLYPAFPYTLLLAAVILIYLNLERLGRTEWPLVRRHERAAGAFFGIAAGLSEGTANIAAPPLIVYYLALGLTPAMLVQALNICFLTGKSTQFFTLATVGGVSATQWLSTVPLMAASAVGALYGVRVRDRIDAATYRRWLKAALLAIAFVLCAQFAWQHL